MQTMLDKYVCFFSSKKKERGCECERKIIINASVVSQVWGLRTNLTVLVEAVCVFVCVVFQSENGCRA